MSKQVRAANRLELDYREEAARFQKLQHGITDVHSHINGKEAAAIYKESAELYGIKMTYSMSKLEEVDAVRSVLGDKIRFIAVPRFMGDDPLYDHTEGFLERLETFYEKGARVVKFWSAPRGLDFGAMAGDEGLMRLDSAARIKVMERAVELGMILMTHVGDPDTWFSTRYLDSERYGTKAEQYDPLRELLVRFNVPWIAAHMGGWPEDLEFLSELLSEHENLYFDSSATKWMVRELSKHSREDLIEFLTRWKGRIMFGSDIVTSDEDLLEGEDHPFELYSSRYWALRTLFETDYNGESSISDPDLNLVEPEKYHESDAPIIEGKTLPLDVLDSLYHQAAADLLDPLY